MLQSQGSLLESLESRTLFSGATLSQDQAALALARAQYKYDEIKADAVLDADKAAAKLHPIKADPKVAAMVATWKIALLNRKTLLAQDRLNLTTATDNDTITIVQDHLNVKADKAAKNTAQLAIDQAALNAALLKLATDRKGLIDILAGDIITTKANVALQHVNILTQEQTDGADPTSIAIHKTRVVDSITWTNTLATDQTVIAAAELKVAQDLYS